MISVVQARELELTLTTKFIPCDQTKSAPKWWPTWTGEMWRIHFGFLRKTVTILTSKIVKNKNSSLITWRYRPWVSKQSSTIFNLLKAFHKMTVMIKSLPAVQTCTIMSSWTIYGCLSRHLQPTDGPLRRSRYRDQNNFSCSHGQTKTAAKW